MAGQSLWHIDSSRRFWAKVEKTDWCWSWVGCKRGKQGYGAVTRKGVTYQAHRAAYEMEIGPIPEGMQVCHHCDTPACVRPAHLFLGTQKDNAQDMIEKGRRGSGNRKLTPAEVQAIYASVGLHREIALRFNISRRQVSNIKGRRQWKEVNE